MTLPPPTYTFTLPSIHDDTNLSCRIYHPSKLLHPGWSKRGAIVAHPYAPLGGCFADPLVLLVGAELLRAGYIVATFNFRGAGDSGGRTSWTGRAELCDYVSLYGFMIHYLHFLVPSRMSDLSPKASEYSEITSTSPQDALSGNGDSRIDQADTVLVLGGYSYGSMITAHLPAVDVVLEIFDAVPVGSAEAEISSRASTLSTRTNKELLAGSQRRSQSLKVNDAIKGASRSVALGSSEEGSRRSSRDSRRSMDSLRRGLSKKIGSKNDGIDREPDVAEKLPCRDIPTPDIRYLLISPLLPPISSFATMFSKITFTPREGSSLAKGRIICDDFDSNLTTRPTLAIYGDQDLFTSGKRLRKWCESLSSRPNSTFQFKEIEGAGHFWHEEGVTTRMKAMIREWL